MVSTFRRARFVAAIFNLLRNKHYCACGAAQNVAHLDFFRLVEINLKAIFEKFIF